MPDRGNQEESRQLTIVTGERIPVVDDEPQYSENVCQGMGYESLVAHNGFEALSRMTEHLPDFVISDM
jgi:DNA-binding response OmpR family regulator